MACYSRRARSSTECAFRGRCGRAQLMSSMVARPIRRHYHAAVHQECCDLRDATWCNTSILLNGVYDGWKQTIVRITLDAGETCGARYSAAIGNLTGVPASETTATDFPSLAKKSTNKRVERSKRPIELCRGWGTVFIDAVCSQAHSVQHSSGTSHVVTGMLRLCYHTHLACGHGFVRS